MRLRLRGFKSAAFAVMIVASAQARAAAGNPYSFGAQWVADVPPKPYCSPSHLTLEVRQGVLMGNVVNDEGAFAVTGEIDRSGRGVIGIGQVAGVIRFHKGYFVADYPNFRCGLRHVVGTRVSFIPATQPGSLQRN